jgi:hypothetical protein
MIDRLPCATTRRRRFDPSGQVLRGPAVDPLRAYPAALSGAAIAFSLAWRSPSSDGLAGSPPSGLEGFLEVMAFATASVFRVGR